MEMRKRTTLEILGVMALASFIGLYTGAKITDKKEDTLHKDTVATLTEEKNSAVMRFSAMEPKYEMALEENGTYLDSITGLNEEVAKANNAASWCQSEYNILKPMYEASLDSLNKYKVDNDNLTCERENFIECLQEKNDELNKVTAKYNEQKLLVANRDNQIGEYQDSLNLAHKWLNIYVANRCFPLTKEKQIGKSYVPLDMHVIPYPKENFKFLKEQNKRHKAYQTRGIKTF